MSHCFNYSHSIYIQLSSHGGESFGLDTTVLGGKGWCACALTNDFRPKLPLWLGIVLVRRAERQAMNTSPGNQVRE